MAGKVCPIQAKANFFRHPSTVIQAYACSGIGRSDSTHLAPSSSTLDAFLALYMSTIYHYNTMKSNFSYIHLYTDSAGETHLEHRQLELERKDFSPPTPYLDGSAPEAVQTTSLLRLPIGWSADWHPSPCRQWQYYLEGEIYFEASDGSSCTVPTGGVVLLEDTTGKGHMSRALNDKTVALVSVKIGD